MVKQDVISIAGKMIFPTGVPLPPAPPGSVLWRGG
jgi:hypothetical protein